MNFTDLKFYDQGKRCTRIRIAKMERALGKKLPEDYAKFIKQTGGGTLSLKNCLIEGFTPPDEEDGLLIVDQIFGTAVDAWDEENDLVVQAQDLAEEWEIPAEVLLIGYAESGMHQCFVINYGLSEFAQHAVLYLDNDEPGQYHLIANSFTEFINKLVPSPDYDEDQSREGIDQKNLDDMKRAREGRLSPQLSESIRATGIEDYEKIVRRAAYILAGTERGFSVWASNPAWGQLLDVVYWAAQHIQPSPNLDSFTGASSGHTPRDENEYQYISLVQTSFVLEGEINAVLCSDAMLIIWWKRRVEEGVLVETPDGYKLKDEYIAPILQELRNQL